MNSNVQRRNELRRRYGYKCGYCGISERDVHSAFAFEVDHFRPPSALPGIPSSLSNLVYACSDCNRTKGTFWSEEAGKRILHPLESRYSDHIERLPDGIVRGTTEDGRSTIDRLRLNRPTLVRWRQQEDRAVRERQEVVRSFFEQYDTIESIRVRATDERLRTELVQLASSVRQTYARLIKSAHEVMEPVDLTRAGGALEVIDWAARAKELTPYLMAHLSHLPERISELDPYVFEQVVAEYFASIGFGVKLLGRNPNTGADIMAVRKEDAIGVEIRYLIEVKRHRNRIGIEEIDRVLGALHREKERLGWHLALVVSVSGFKDFRSTNPDHLRMLGIELKDGADVARYLRSYKPRIDGGLWLPRRWDEQLPGG